MAREILVVPEEDLVEVISVIRRGLEDCAVSDKVREALTTWCNEERTMSGRKEAKADGGHSAQR